jgi:putative DNA primase/helicase
MTDDPKAPGAEPEPENSPETGGEAAGGKPWSIADFVADAVEGAEAIPFKGEAPRDPPMEPEDDGEDAGEDMAAFADGGGHGGDEPPPHPDVFEEDPHLRACIDEPTNDIGNGRRMLHRNGADIVHIPRIGWYVFDARRWAEDVDGRVLRPLAHQVAEAIGREAYVMEATPQEKLLIDAMRDAKKRRREIAQRIAEIDDSETGKDEKARLKRALRLEELALDETIAAGEGARKEFQARKGQRRRFALSSGNAGKLDAMISEALPYRSRPLEDFDAEEMAFNVLNGTLRFRKVEVDDPDNPDPDVPRKAWEWRVQLDPHRRDDLNTKLAPVTYDRDAVATVFDGFIRRIMPIESVRGFNQRSLGLTLTTIVAEQCFWIWHGEGANGKSTLADAIAELLGDYATTVPVMSLVNDQPRQGAQPTPDLNGIPGARMVRASEPKAGLPLDESLIKQLTGGEPILLRRLNQESNAVRPLFKLFISVNKKPTIRGDDLGIWRRVHLVPFTVIIPKEERDKRLPDKLAAERSGILNWLVDGLLDYLNNGGLRPPEEVVAATEDYRADSDDLGRFIREALEVTLKPEHQTAFASLYKAYEVWCNQAVKTPLNKTAFSRRFPDAAARAGFEKQKSSSIFYLGVLIRQDYFVPDP